MTILPRDSAERRYERAPLPLTGSFGAGIATRAPTYLGTRGVLAWYQDGQQRQHQPRLSIGPVFVTWRPAPDAATRHGLRIARLARRRVRALGDALNGSTAVTNSSLSSIIVPFQAPPPPTQPGPDTIDFAVDERPTDAVWKDNKLAFVSTFPCDPVGGLVENRDCVRVSELSTANPAAPTRRQDFLIAQPLHDLFMGGIGYALNDDLHVAWTRSGEAAGITSSYGAYQDAGCRQ